MESTLDDTFAIDIRDLSRGVGWNTWQVLSHSTNIQQQQQQFTLIYIKNIEFHESARDHSS